LRGVLGLDQLYPLVCVTAALSSFLGCGYSVLKGKGTSMLSVPVVVVVFLSLTLAAALLTAEAVNVENGLTGLGLSMAAGGLLAEKRLEGLQQARWRQNYYSSLALHVLHIQNPSALLKRNHLTLLPLAKTHFSCRTKTPRKKRNAI